jgi:MoxR-like ATPase
VTGSTLDHLIPHESFWKRYVPRHFPGTDKTDIEILEVAMRKQMNILMVGPTGPGKTSACLAVCAKNGWPLGVGNFNGMTTVEDLVGQVLPTADGTSDMEPLIEAAADARGAVIRAKVLRQQDELVEAERALAHAEYRLEAAYKAGAGLEWTDGLLVKLMKGDPRFEVTAFLADEVNFAPAKVSSVMNGVTDDRRQITLLQHHGEVVTAHDGFAFLAAMNPNYEGTRPLNAAFKDRFHLKLAYEYDEAIEKKIVREPRLAGMAKKLREAFASEDLTTPTGTRTLLAFERVEELFGREFAIENLVTNYEEDERPSVREVAGLHLRGRGKGTTKGPTGVGPDVS